MSDKKETLEELNEILLHWGIEKGILDCREHGCTGNTESQLKGMATEIIEISLNPEADDEWGDAYVWFFMALKSRDKDITTCVKAAVDKITKRTGRLVNGVFVKD